jgi:hypothetical protein
MSLAGFLYNVYFIVGAVDKDIVCTEAGESDLGAPGIVLEGRTDAA